MFIVLYGIDRIVGPYRAAELVNEYRRRLQEEDSLPERAALAVACTAYAFNDIYILASPGQVWKSFGLDDMGHSEPISIIERVHDPLGGHCVRVLTACGISEIIPIDRLGCDYYLSSWPQDPAD
ncbi:hypothetical protein [Streptomyces sp. NPDC051014]|uniref:hypothetical protein n=1 Tax=Streptomyces sp. NPDC051014 TaxID=3155751 RepID=UPI00340954A3